MVCRWRAQFVVRIRSGLHPSGNHNLIHFESRPGCVRREVNPTAPAVLHTSRQSSWFESSRNAEIFWSARAVARSE
jgi:hypothetical protein